MDAIKPHFAARKNVELFERNHVFTEREVRSRMEIMLENYSKVLTIEGLTMIEMAKKDIYPAVNAYLSDLCAAVYRKETMGAPVKADKEVIARLSNDNEGLYFAAERVEELLAAAKEAGGAEKTARFFADEVVPAMQKLRAFADDMEQNTAKKYWPFPTYGDILFSV